MSIRETILGEPVGTLEKVPLPWLGIEVWVKSLSAYEVLHAGTSPEGLEAVAVVTDTACDEDGTLVFTRDDVEALAKKSMRTVNAIYRAAARLNGMLAGESEEEAVKNSETTTAPDSTAG